MGERALAAKMTHVPPMLMSEQEGPAPDTALLYGALGWDKYDAQCEVVTAYSPSSDTSQTNVTSPLQ